MGWKFNPLTGTIDLVYTFPPNFTAGSLLIADGSGGVTQDNAQLFWDNTNDRLGVGTNSPQYKLHIVAPNVYPIEGPIGGNASLLTNQPSGYPSDGIYNFYYRVYAYKNVSGTTYYAPTPTTAATNTSVSTVTAPTENLSNPVINYGFSGYTATGNTITYDVWTKISTAQGDVWSVTPASNSVTDDNSSNQYSVSLSWTNTSSFTDVILVRNGTDYIQFGYAATSYNDSNSGWSVGGFGPPSPTSVYDTVAIQVTWSPSSMPDGYRIVRQDSYHPNSYDYYIDVSGGSTSYLDDNYSFSYSPTLSPTTQFSDALKITGNVGFYGATPVSRYTPVGASGYNIGGGSNANDTSTWTGGIGSSAYTVGDIVKALKLIGILS